VTIKTITRKDLEQFDCVQSFLGNDSTNTQLFIVYWA